MTKDDLLKAITPLITGTDPKNKEPQVVIIVTEQPNIGDVTVFVQSKFFSREKSDAKTV